MSKNPLERIKALGKPIEPKVEKLNKGGKTLGHKSLSENGGVRAGAGRKPNEEKLVERGLKAIMDEHFGSKAKIEIRDPKTGQTRIIDKPRALILLERLFVTAQTTGDVSAIKEWFDRAVGKSPQTFRGDAQNPFRVDLGLSEVIAEKIYGNKPAP